MKRLFGILLCAVMLISLAAPTASASFSYGKDDNDGERNRIETTEETVEEPALEEAAPELTDEPGEPFADMDGTPGIPDVPDCGQDGPAVLMEGGNKITVKVKLPAGATAGAGSQAIVYLYKPAETDGSGLVTGEPQWAAGMRVYFETGATSADAVFEVEDGKYFILVNTRINSASVLNGYSYFSADGTLVGDMYSPKGFEVSGSAEKTVTLPEAPCGASGTLRFSEPLKEDVTFSVRAYSSDYRARDSMYADVAAKKGDRSVKFGIGLDKGSYYLRFECNNILRYCSLNGDLTKTHNEARIFYTADGKSQQFSNLSFTADELLPASFNVKLSVGSASENKREICIFAYDADSDYHYRYYTSIPGGSTVSESVPFQLDPSRIYCLGYFDSTQWSGFESLDAVPDVRYASADGVTSIAGNAEQFSIKDGDSLTITDKSACRITGTLERGDYYQGYAVAGYAMAYFEDGEMYAARVIIPANASSASYSIEVPKSEKGKSFSLCAAPANSGLYTSVSDNAERTPGGTYTLGNRVAAQTMTLIYGGVSPAPTFSTTYTITLPITAQKGGVSLRLLEDDSVTIANCVIPEGKKSITVTVDRYTGGPVYGYLNSLYDGIWVSTAAEGDRISFMRTAVISGSVNVPRDVTEGVKCRVVGGDRSYVDASILPGQKSASYSIVLPECELEYYYAYIRADLSGKLSTSAKYVDSSWNAARNNSDPPTVSGNRTGVDFTFDKVKTVSGKFVADDGSAVEISVPDGWSCYAYLYDDNGKGTRCKVTVNGASWSFNVAPELVGAYRLGITVSQTFYTNIFSGTYYYSTDSTPVKSYSSAQKLAIGEDSLSGIRIMVRTGWRITGSIAMPGGSHINQIGSTKSSLSVYAYDGERSYYNESAPIDASSTSWSYQIVVPKVSGAEYSIGFGNNSHCYEYYETDLMLSYEHVEFAKLKVLRDNTAAPTYTIEKAGTFIRGEVYRTIDYEGEYDADVFIEINENDTYMLMQATAYLGKGENVAYWTIAIPAANTAEGYILYVDYYFYDATSLYIEAYLNADGRLTTDMDDLGYYKFSGAKYYRLNSLIGTYPLESAHGVSGDTYMYYYYDSGIRDSITLTFTTMTDVIVNINGTEHDVRGGGGVTVDGTSFIISISPGNDREYYGFAVQTIDASGGYFPSSIAAVFSPGGSADSLILNDVRQGGSLTVTTLSCAGLRVFAAAYDSEGRLLEVVTGELGANGACRLWFDSGEAIDSLRIMMLERRTFEPATEVYELGTLQ